MTRTELKAAAEETRVRELDCEERNLRYNIRHARDDEERRQARAAYEIWSKHVRFGR